MSNLNLSVDLLALKGAFFQNFTGKDGVARLPMIKTLRLMLLKELSSVQKMPSHVKEAYLIKAWSAYKSNSYKKNLPKYKEETDKYLIWE